MGVENEALIRAVKALLESSLPAALDAVEAEWAAIEAISLPDPVDYFIGEKPDVLDLESSAFPFVSIITPRRVPDEDDKAEWGYQSAIYTIWIQYYVHADDKATVNLRTMRYAQAIVNVLQTQSSFAGRNQYDYEPALDLTYVATRQLVDGTVGDVGSDADLDYIQMGRITMTVK